MKRRNFLKGLLFGAPVVATAVMAKEEDKIKYDWIPYHSKNRNELIDERRILLSIPMSEGNTCYWVEDDEPSPIGSAPKFSQRDLTLIGSHVDSKGVMHPPKWIENKGVGV